LRSTILLRAEPIVALQVGIKNLDQRIGGLFGYRSTIRASPDEAGFVTKEVEVGDVSQPFDSGSEKDPRPRPDGLQGGGTGLTEEEASLSAFCEAAERYCAAVFSPGDFVLAPANGLEEACLDLDDIPRCSERELSNPRCPLIRPDKSKPIRWMLGISLPDGAKIYIPAVMVYTYIGHMYPGERICFPMSTGCAAHDSVELALIGGICEVVERDATALVWLQKLPLPRIVVDDVPKTLAPHVEALERSSRHLEYFFFDATTDLGIPTVYGVQRSLLNPIATTLVSCATAMTATEALAKVMRDMFHVRTAFRQPRPVPDAAEDFTNIFHGAALMAKAERAECFDFLLKSESRRRLSEIPEIQAGSCQAALQLVLERLRMSKMSAYAVELSTDECLRAGLRVVKAIIPALQPISFNYRARFLGHPRLYDAPGRMGYRALKEADLNPWPQPFA
jgi:ribosomal protein S12 methylthiotransferase accessory factor